VFEREGCSDTLLFSPSSRNVLKGKASSSFSLTYFMLFSDVYMSAVFWAIGHILQHLKSDSTKKKVHTAAKQGVALLLWMCFDVVFDFISK
jgi:hypothetical protein